MLNPTFILLMALEIVILLITAGCVYLKLIPNDLLIFALGAIIRGMLSIVPTLTAITTNTNAVQANTVATVAAIETKDTSTK